MHPYGSRLRAATLVLRDLVSQGWRLRVVHDVVEIAQPDDRDTTLHEKERVRAQLNIERDRQLSHSAARAFIRSMERRGACTEIATCPSTH